VWKPLFYHPSPFFFSLLVVGYLLRQFSKGEKKRGKDDKKKGS
jgi:hypothetical protein